MLVSVNGATCNYVVDKVLIYCDSQKKKKGNKQAQFLIQLRFWNILDIKLFNSSAVQEADNISPPAPSPCS